LGLLLVAFSIIAFLLELDLRPHDESLKPYEFRSQRVTYAFRARLSSYMGNQTHERRRGLGLCIECGERPPDGAFSRCRGCRQVAAAKGVHRRAGRRERRLCSACGAAALPLLGRCFSCSFGLPAGRVLDWVDLEWRHPRRWLRWRDGERKGET
jgi:hypothetical protein